MPSLSTQQTKLAFASCPCISVDATTKKVSALCANTRLRARCASAKRISSGLTSEFKTRVAQSSPSTLENSGVCAHLLRAIDARFAGLSTDVVRKPVSPNSSWGALLPKIFDERGVVLPPPTEGLLPRAFAAGEAATAMRRGETSRGGLRVKRDGDGLRPGLADRSGAPLRACRTGDLCRWLCLSRAALSKLATTSESSRRTFA